MAINRKIQTLDEFTIQQMRDFPKATGELSGLLRDIGLAAKRVHVEVNKAGLVDILGDAGTMNVQGEEVKKLDVFANNQFMGVLRHGISCAGIGSEERIACTGGHDDYFACFHTFDGTPFIVEFTDGFHTYGSQHAGLHAGSYQSRTECKAVDDGCQHSHLVARLQI